MTPEIALVLLILLGALLLFVTEWVRMDVVALLVLLSVGLTGLVTPTEAFSGFSSPAVVTVWAMFIISGALTVTGVAETLGGRLVRIAGDGEVRLIIAIMATAGVLSAFMNNVGVAAMMLPVVVKMARRTGHPPSRLLLPLALGCLLGGLTTLIGTPPNILVADAVREYGLPPLSLFDFAPIGIPILVGGILFVVLVGRHMLPSRDPMRENGAAGRDPGAIYELGERLFTIRIPDHCAIAGRTLEASRIGAALQMNVVAVVRHRKTILAPPGSFILQPDDQLLALGRMSLAAEVRKGRFLEVEELRPDEPEGLLSKLHLEEGVVQQGSPLAGRPLFQARLRERFGVHVLAIRRGPEVRDRDLQDFRLSEGDLLLFHCAAESAEAFRASPELSEFRSVPVEGFGRAYELPGRVLTFRVPNDSPLAGHSLRRSRLREVLGLDIWAIRRGNEVRVMPGPEDVTEPGDSLLVHGMPADLEIPGALQQLEIEAHPMRTLDALQSAEVGIAELVLSPESMLVGRTLRELDFRDRHGVTVLAVWREGEVHRTELRDWDLRFGDAILVHGPRDKLRLLARDPDFVVLTEAAPPPARKEKAPLAIGILAAVLLPVFFGWTPIALAAVAGAVLMVLTRCLSMEDAYRFIEWRAVFLIAGMLPLGLAMERTGAARLLSDGVLSVTGNMGPHVVLAGIFVLTALAAQVVPTAATVVLMAPIAFNTATDLGVSPLPMLMTVAMAASASLSSPVSHPANTLVMGPGGYRFIDYVKVGTPLNLLVLVIVLILVPIFWPFSP